MISSSPISPSNLFMKRFALAVSAALLLSPLVAAAAAMTPGELFTQLQESGSPRSFSVTAHGESQGMYVSVWANGVQQGMTPDDMTMSTKATVDIVQNDMKVRLKGEVIVVDGMVYVKVTNLNASATNAFASFSAIANQKQWFATPLDMVMLRDIAGPVAMNLGSVDASKADGMFTMQSAGTKSGTNYTLNLNTDYAAELALMIRELLQDTQPASTDFFPWRELAEGMHFEMNISTDTTGAFVSSNYTMSMDGRFSEFTASGKETALKGALAIKAPADAVTIEDLMKTFNQLSGDLPQDMMEEDMMMPIPMEPTDESMETTTEPVWSEPNPACTDPETSPLKLLTLQRTGECPVEKITTRYEKPSRR